MEAGGYVRANAVVVIPVYRNTLDVFERISLEQVRQVLSQYDLVFVAPVSLQLDYGTLSEGIAIERFPDAYFTGTEAYSRLLLSTGFYERFAAYEYMLIYQLDAFVFQDRLAKFCQLGYDYIGAPLKRYAAYWRDIHATIGNGGFSLRRIASVLRVLQDKDALFARRPAAWRENYFLKWEDLFFAFCGVLPDVDFRVPNFLTALDFAVGENTSHVYDRMPEWLPFGCHGWNKVDYWYWQPVIERCGYALPEPSECHHFVARQRGIYRYLCERMLRNRFSGNVLRQYLETLFCDRSQLAIWGWGVFGQLMERILRKAGYERIAIYDQSGSGASHAGRQIQYPVLDEIRSADHIVIVAAVRHEDEICADLQAAGMVENRDFVRVSTILESLFRQYLQAFRDFKKVREMPI